jgi:hypothetical protein
MTPAVYPPGADQTGLACPQPERRAEATLARGEWWKKWPWMKTRYTTWRPSHRPC